MNSRRKNWQLKKNAFLIRYWEAKALKESRTSEMK
jgi:preprotein translocase subunit Sec61beta